MKNDRHLKLDEASLARADAVAEKLASTGAIAHEDSVFFSRELELISQELAKVKYAELEAAMFLPKRIQVPEGVDTYTWKLYDQRGEAVPMSGGDSGAPLAEVDGEEMSSKLMSYKMAYSYDVEEIAKARHAGMPLDSMRAEACRRALAEKSNYLALLGNSNKGIYGLFNQQNTNTPSLVGTAWSSATAANMLDDLFEMVDEAANNSYSIEGSGELYLLLPKSRIRIISKTPRTTTDSTTVMEYFQRNRPNVKIFGANYLDTAGSGGVARGVCYDPSQVAWLNSVPYNQLAPQVQGFRTVVNAYNRIGGVVCSFPKSITYGDNI